MPSPIAPGSDVNGVNTERAQANLQKKAQENFEYNYLSMPVCTRV